MKKEGKKKEKVRRIHPCRSKPPTTNDTSNDTSNAPATLYQDPVHRDTTLPFGFRYAPYTYTLHLPALLPLKFKSQKQPYLTLPCLAWFLEKKKKSEREKRNKKGRKKKEMTKRKPCKKEKIHLSRNKQKKKKKQGASPNNIF